MSEEKYLVLLYSYIPFGPVRTSLLVSYFGSAKKAWEASEKELHSTGLKGEFVRGFILYRSKLSGEKFFKELKKKILEVLDKEPIHLDKVVRISSMDVSTVSARLTIMVMKGLVTDLGNGMYRKNII